jgi:hypothetical protein
MNPTETLNRQHELEERRLGMRSSDPADIARHFGKAAELRVLIAKERLRLVHGASGTKGSSPRRPL